MKHREEIKALEERHENELDLVQEQRVIEMNLLDAELLDLREAQIDLREEKNQLAEQLLKSQEEVCARSELEEVEVKQKRLLEDAEKERNILGKFLNNHILI